MGFITLLGCIVNERNLVINLTTLMVIYVTVWKKQRRICMLLAPPPTLDSSVLYPKKRLKNSKVCIAVRCKFAWFSCITSIF